MEEFLAGTRGMGVGICFSELLLYRGLTVVCICKLQLTIRRGIIEK